METQHPTKPKSVVRAFSMWDDQVARLERLVSFDRQGVFSQFVRDAVSEKLDRLEADKELEIRLTRAG